MTELSTGEGIPEGRTLVGEDDEDAASRSQRTPILGRRWVIYATRLLVFVAFLTLWETAVSNRWVSPLLVPSLGGIAERFTADVSSIITGGGMQRHFITTVIEVYVAFAIVAVGGILLGVLITESIFVNKVVYPYIVAFAAMPRIAIAPLILIWFGFEMESKIVIAVLVAIFPTLVATIVGLNNTEEAKLRLMRVLGASSFETFRKVRFGDALPYIFAGLQTSVVVVSIGVVVGEFAGGRQGLGVLITVYQDSLEVAGTFSAIILLSLIGLFNYYAMQAVRRRVIFWVGE